MSQPKVSVIMRVYCHTDDHWQFLRETLQSVADQTYRDFELVIVDDVSPRDILPLLDSIEGLPSVRVLRNLANMRHAESRNSGIRAAKGELVAFLDHDDIWKPEKLARQVQAFEANPDAGMVFCNLAIFGPQANRLIMDQSIIPDRPDFCWFAIHGNYTISATAVMAKKQAMLDIGLFDSRYTTCDDIDAWLKILTMSPVVHIPEELASYRLHSCNVSYTGDALNDNKLLTALMWRYCLSAPLSDKVLLLPKIIRKCLGRPILAAILYRRRLRNKRSQTKA